MLTSSGIKDKQKVSNYKSCLGTMNHGPIKGAIMFLVLFSFFWSVPPSPPPSQIILCIRFALIGLTVSGREMDDLTDVILWMKETHETTASIFLLLDLALKD